MAATPMPPQLTPGARSCMSILPPAQIEAPGFDWTYEVQVAVPATYDVLPAKQYPVLWVTDGPAYVPLVVGLLNALCFQHVPEMIVVGVGCPPELGLLEHGRRRSTDFAPPGASFFYSGFAGERLKEMAAAGSFQPPPQYADRLLRFLVDTLRPDLAQRFRMADEHALFGHSGGGMFAGWVLFERPEAFAKYIIGSPSINAAERAVFRMEEAYAASRTDLPVSLFLGAGELEIVDPLPAAWGLASSPVLLAETLRLRNYPSLKLHARIFPGKDHLTVIPDILADGLRALWPKTAV